MNEVRNELETQEIMGTVTHVVYKKEDTGFAVFEMETEDGDEVTVVGPVADVGEGELLTVVGAFQNHPSFGVQFRALYCEYKLPETSAAILRYLSSGALPGIGPVTAKRLVDAFGSDTLEIIAGQPERLAKVRGLSIGKAREIGEVFRRRFGVREAIAYLARLGIGAATAIEVYRFLGSATVELLQSNIYLLCGAPAYLPFDRVDGAAMERSHDPEGENRLSAAILYVLRHNTGNGHTCLPADKLLNAASALGRVEPELMGRALDRLVEDGRLFREEFGAASYVFLPDYYRAERYIAAEMRHRAASAPPDGPAREEELSQAAAGLGLSLAELQRQAVEQAAANACFILTGGPGTGKTTTVKAILALLENRGDRVLLAAPTGRAAKRLEELTGREAKTIHRLLEVAFGSAENGVQFVRNEENPLRCDAVVVDEMSMVDVLLFESLLRAMPAQSRLIMVGDHDQLPSVGPGNLLRDLLDSTLVPSISLTQVFRQASKSLIVVNAHNIVEGRPIVQGKGEQSDCFFLTQGRAGFAETLRGLVTQRLPEKYGFNPVTDIQVLCPSRVGEGGTEALNRAMQGWLNPLPPGSGQVTYMGQVFRAGDKVMQVRNNYDIIFKKDNGEGGTGAFNGDIGFVQSVNPQTGGAVIRFDDRLYAYTADQLGELEPAWAVTIHKSQGSEFPAVILPVLDPPVKLQYRNLLYTGVTRARSLLIVLGSPQVMDNMARNNRRNRRYCGLPAFLKDEDFI